MHVIKIKCGNYTFYITTEPKFDKSSQSLESHPKVHLAIMFSVWMLLM
uniref:Uncharacterized protein n=1 Tax=Rhizophora mucronata TaxID=61149 RepID=A0A2P2P2H3_RHIMU